ncbi:MAG: dihydroorotate dehydrogenase electron transfer subunit [Desulfobulbaceae bacterium]|nr:dihydroorotate dehydrogenase electron transfer subunit [Desulfobulbaceae bacterium]
MLVQASKITFNRKLAEGTFYMALESPEIAAAAVPGQFVMIRVGNGLDPLLRRPLSLCGVHEDGRIFLLYRVVGSGTAILSQMNRGESLSVLGPLGKGFRLPEKGERALLVAGGMGIAPLIFLAEKISSGLSGFYAGYGSSRDQVPLVDLPMGDAKVSIATEDGSAGHRGLVTDLLEAGLVRFPDGLPKVYACGPLPMLKAVSVITGRKNIPCQVSLEASMACGLGACQGCAVKIVGNRGTGYGHVCQDGPVFDAGLVDWEVL